MIGVKGFERFGCLSHCFLQRYTSLTVHVEPLSLRYLNAPAFLISRFKDTAEVQPAKLYLSPIIQRYLKEISIILSACLRLQ